MHWKNTPDPIPLLALQESRFRADAVVQIMFAVMRPGLWTFQPLVQSLVDMVVISALFNTWGWAPPGWKKLGPKN